MFNNIYHEGIYCQDNDAQPNFSVLSLGLSGMLQNEERWSQGGSGPRESAVFSSVDSGPGEQPSELPSLEAPWSQSPYIIC